ncbi:MAG: hypothetical protein II881_07305 [Oscillospiraceae bacterium]|nr:hypothetical protein [Oscillospiraceae bacterium]MBR0302346.1 hypothetical protein [Clostridia bacterium]
MVKVIMGLKGEGKTKKLIDLVKTAIDTESGDVVVIEGNAELTYDIPYRARLVQMSESGYEFLKGYISGLHSGNYDITHIFVDALLKLAGDKDLAKAEEFLNWVEAFGEKENVKFTITISADSALATEGIKKFF